MIRQILSSVHCVSSQTIPLVRIPPTITQSKSSDLAHSSAYMTTGHTKRRPKSATVPARKTSAKGAVDASTILVVDDDPSVLRALSRLIRAAGFKVLAFDRPSALLASAIPKADACLILDMNLPEMNGTELCRALAISGHRLPVILITGRSDPTTQRLIEEAHPVAALYKPIDEQSLFDAIARALDFPENESRE